jgi:hypothetical protein
VFIKERRWTYMDTPKKPQEDIMSQDIMRVYLAEEGKTYSVADRLEALLLKKPPTPTKTIPNESNQTPTKK